MARWLLVFVLACAGAACAERNRCASNGPPPVPGSFTPGLQCNGSVVMERSAR